VSKYNQASKLALGLEEEVLKLKEELYLSNSELSLVRQEFSTFRLLHEIDIAKKQ
jgi:hypothetical protein